LARYYRKVIRISAEESPNVRYARAQIERGREPTGKILVPGVLPWADYLKRRALWDPIRQCIGLDGEFYEGAEVLLFPPDWLNRAERLAEEYWNKPRRALGIGIDPAEGGDKTAMAAVDQWGLVDLVSKRTPDTSVIGAEALAFMRKHQVSPDRVIFDRGGGGKQIADVLRRQGVPVRTVAFGESLSPDIRRSPTPFGERVDLREDKYAYKNRRAQMYGELRLQMDPAGVDGDVTGFALPVNSRNVALAEACRELRRQLAPIPLLYDPEGRLELPPKNKRDPKSTKVCLIDLIGHSPDEADAVVLAFHAMLHKTSKPKAGALV
jgi:hypothetical protein